MGKHKFRHWKMSKVLLVSLTLALCYVAVGFPLVVIPDISSSSEAREAHVARLMFEGANPILPLRNGIIPSKPPLFHWIGAGLATIVGSFSVSVTRFVSLFAGGLLLSVTFFFSYFFRNCSNPKREDALMVAVLATAILGTCYGFNRLCFDSRVDMLFTLFVVCACFSALARSVCRLEGAFLISEKWWSLLFWILSALAVLTKGPLGLLLPILVGFTTGVCLEGWMIAISDWVKPKLGWIVFLLIVCPWYYFAYIYTSEAFLLKQLLFENFTRFAGGEFITERPWWYYFPSFLRTTFPWGAVFFLLLVGALLKPKQRDLGVRAGQDRIPFALCLWFMVAFVFFMISVGKRHSYLLPTFPAIAIYLAWKITDWMKTLSEAEGWYLRQFGLATVDLAICIFAMLLLLSDLLWDVEMLTDKRIIFSLDWLEHFILPYQIMLGCSLAVLLVFRIITYLGKRYRPYSNHSDVNHLGFYLCCSSTVLLLLVFISIGLGVKAALKGYPKQARFLSEAVGEFSQLYVVRESRDESFDVLLYYYPREVVNLSPKSLIPVCGQPILAHRKWYQAIREKRGDLIFAELLRLNSPMEWIRAKRGRELVLFSCQAEYYQDVI